MAHSFVPANTMAQRLQKLASLYRKGYTSPLMERTINKLLAYEAETCREQLHQVQNDLAEFEQQYALTSADFYQRYQTGQTDDRMDYVEWASLIQIAANLEERLRMLTEETPK